MIFFNCLNEIAIKNNIVILLIFVCFCHAYFVSAVFICRRDVVLIKKIMRHKIIHLQQSSLDETANWNKFAFQFCQLSTTMLTSLICSLKTRV